jgi:hypothetical protein
MPQARLDARFGSVGSGWWTKQEGSGREGDADSVGQRLIEQLPGSV